MNWDEEMMDVIDGEKISMQARNSNLNEDLGCVEHIFSDKTGTITQNCMTLEQWIINENSYSQSEQPNCLQLAYENGNNSVRDFILALGLCNTAIPRYVGFQFESFFFSIINPSYKIELNEF